MPDEMPDKALDGLACFSWIEDEAAVGGGEKIVSRRFAVVMFAKGPDSAVGGDAITERTRLVGRSSSPSLLEFSLLELTMVLFARATGSSSDPESTSSILRLVRPRAASRFGYIDEAAVGLAGEVDEDKPAVLSPATNAADGGGVGSDEASDVRTRRIVGPEADPNLTLPAAPMPKLISRPARNVKSWLTVGGRLNGGADATGCVSSG